MLKDLSLLVQMHEEAAPHELCMWVAQLRDVERLVTYGVKYSAYARGICGA